MTNLTPPDEATEYHESQWRLGPRVWGPVVGFLGVVAVALALVLPLALALPLHAIAGALP